MTEQSSEDWLPQGWTVQVRVRKNGKRDKYYFAPSSGIKFNSKAEVSRYLNTQEISDLTPEQNMKGTLDPTPEQKIKGTLDPTPEQKIKGTLDPTPEQNMKGTLDPTPEQKIIGTLDPTPEQKIKCTLDPTPEQKIKGTLKRSAKNVEVEKVIAEGLPPGWIKEIRVKKRGQKIRRDPFYTDPVSGYVFRSMKDVVRYLKTGDIGKLAFKPKDKGDIDVELEDETISSLAVTKKQKLAVSSTKKQIVWDQSSKLDEIVKDAQIIKSDSTEECARLSQHTSDQCRVDNDLSSSTLLESKGSEQTEGQRDPAKSVVVSAPAVGVLAEQSLESEAKMHENSDIKPELQKSKNKKELNLPRRASKRLAGIELDPVLELKTSRTRRVVGKQSGEAGSSTPPCSSPGSLAHWACQQPDQLEAGLETESVIDTSKSTKVLLESMNEKYPYAKLTTPIEHRGKVERENKGDQKKNCTALSHVGNLAISEDHAGKVEKGNKSDEKPEIPIELPSMDLWSDPCIQFAIKTLTGVAIESPRITELLPVSDGSMLATGDLATLATSEHVGKVETDNKNGKKQGCTVVLPSRDLSVTEHDAGKVENNYKDDEKPGSPLDMPVGDSWMDPCIEFAIKTLTGAIPVECVLDIQDSFQSQQSSSQTQASSGLTSQNVGFNSFCQTDLLCQQFDAMEKPNYRHQALAEPALPQTGNVSLQNSGTTVLHQHGEERGNRCQQ